MAEIKLNPQMIGGMAAAVIVVVIGLGLYGRVTAMETRVTELNVAVEQLADVQDQITAIDLELARVNADVTDIAMARDDILRNICQVLELPPSRCGVAA